MLEPKDRDPGGKCGFEDRPVFAEEKSGIDPVRQLKQRVEIFIFPPAPGHPADLLEAGQRRCRRRDVGCLAVIDEGDAGDRCQLLHSVRQAPKIGQGWHQVVGPGSGRPRGGPRGDCVLPVVLAGDPEQRVHGSDGAVAAVEILVQHATLDPDTALAALVRRNCDDPWRIGTVRQPVPYAQAVRIVNADDRDVVGTLRLKDLFFCRDVGLPGPMPVQVVGPEVQQQRDVRPKFATAGQLE